MIRQTSSLFLLLLLLLSGCDNNHQRSGLPPLEDMNVLVIVIDTLRADDLGCYTPELDVSPNIDALARHGVVFQRAIAPAPWTQPSVSSLMTGLIPSHHGTLQVRDQLSEDHTTMAERFSARGFQTAAVVSHHLLAADLGYGQGFDSFDESSVTSSKNHSSFQVTKVAIDQIQRLQDDPFFLFVHYFDPHYEYLHHKQFDRTSAYGGQVRDWKMTIANLRKRRNEMTASDFLYLHQLYREEIAYTDQQVGRLLDELQEQGLDKNTLVILTADHGEEFGEHNWIGHTSFLYDTLIHVPLIFSLPGHLKPNTVSTAVSLIDIVPTLEALAQTPGDEDWDGRSLLNLLGGKQGDNKRAIFSEVAFVSPRSERQSSEVEKEAFLAAVTSDDWKLIHDLERQTWELFSLLDDPGETHNLYTDNHDQAQRLRPLLSEWESGKTENWGRQFLGGDQLDDKERERLRSLGYIH
jgi:choline-sulfatase